MEAYVCLACRQRDQRIAELEAHVARLQQQLEEACRAGKRQAAPFAKGPPTGQPKKPGRKPGTDYGPKAHRQPPSPDQIDEVHEARLPDACPDCGGPLDETQIAQQFQVEIPRQPIHRQFNIHIGKCRQCHRRVQGRHPLQTSDALGAAAAQLGPDTQAAVVELNKQGGLSHGKVTRCLESLFGLPLSRGGSVHTVLRAAARCEPVYAEIRTAVGESDWVVPDETGWRVGGQAAWLHTLVGPEATAYVIDPTRSGAVAEDIVGLDYDGTLIHDGWSPYDQFQDARHQQCLQHLVRRCDAMEAAATRGGVCFPRRIAELLRAGLDLRDRHVAGAISPHGLAVARGHLEGQLFDLVFPPKTNAANERLSKHLWAHRDDLFTFLRQPGLDATNWRAELAIRFGVILRKVWGGSRTWTGARAQAVLMSVWRTCWQQGRSALDFLSQLLRGAPVALALPP
ncbi:MAG TPA: IS66 family transposase [Candidatus Limnocylindria bacterium]|nr:IS66 family transposase [Candidatus Limnocylindria bacterium]